MPRIEELVIQIAELREELARLRSEFEQYRSLQEHTAAKFLTPMPEPMINR